MDYLIVVDYQSDTERKRIDYAIERWKDKGVIHKPKGTVIQYSGEDIDNFLDDIYSRLSAGNDKVHVFAGNAYSPAISEQIKTLEYVSKIDSETIEKFLKYIMNKLGASYEGGKDNIRSYTAYTKKGQVGIDILSTKDNGAHLKLVIRGFGDAVSFVSERIDMELKVFLGDE